MGEDADIIPASSPRQPWSPTPTAPVLLGLSVGKKPHAGASRLCPLGKENQRQSIVSTLS